MAKNHIFAREEVTSHGWEKKIPDNDARGFILPHRLDRNSAKQTTTRNLNARGEIFFLGEKRKKKLRRSLKIRQGSLISQSVKEQVRF